jgi:hypothetical protein
MIGAFSDSAPPEGGKWIISDVICLFSPPQPRRKAEQHAIMNRLLVVFIAAI